MADDFWDDYYDVRRDIRQTRSLERLERDSALRNQRESQLHKYRLEEARADAERKAIQAREAAIQAAAVDQARAQLEAEDRVTEMMEARAAAFNAGIEAVRDDLAHLVRRSLEVDDHLDLEAMRVVVEHPPFSRPDLETPIPPPAPLGPQPEPVYVEPPPPTGLKKAVAGRERHLEEVREAQAAYWEAHRAWRTYMDERPERQVAQEEAHRQAEAARVEALRQAHEAYEAECRAREQAQAPQNAGLAALIAGLAADDERAVQAYIDLVVTTTPYPDWFPTSHRYEYDSGTRQLQLWVGVPPAGALPRDCDYHYDPQAREIVAVDRPEDERRARYADALHQVALRSAHVAFESDRDGRIGDVWIYVGVYATDPALGTEAWCPLVEVHLERQAFAAVQLAKVVPEATLRHFGGRLSPDPLALAPLPD